VVWLPLGGAVLVAFLPAGVARWAGRLVATLCAGLVVFLASSPAVRSDAAIELVYPVSGAPCLRLDAFSWYLSALIVGTLLVAMYWGRRSGSSDGASPAVDSWLLLCAFLGLVASSATALNEAGAVLAATGLMPALYLCLKLPFPWRRLEALWPAIAGGLAALALDAAADAEGPRRLAGMLSLHSDTRLGLMLFMAAAYVGSGMFPFCVWPFRTSLGAGRREAGFLLGSAAFVPGAILLARLAYLSPGGAYLLPAQYNPAPIFLLLACLTAAYLFVEFGDVRSVSGRIGVLAGLHGAYLFMAAVTCTISIGMGLQSVVFMLAARALSFPLIFLSLEWLGPELEKRRGMARLRAVARAHPVGVLALLCGVASAAGVPPFVGFWAKSLLLLNISQSLRPYAYAVAVIFALELAALAWLVLWRGAAVADDANDPVQAPPRSPLRLAILLVLIFANIGVPCILTRVMEALTL